MTDKDHIGAVIFAVLALSFGVLAVVYRNPWAQGLSHDCFTAACVAFQVPKP